MPEAKRITAVMVDTSAFVEKNCDFIGCNSKLIPSFFSLVKEKKILLLSHPIIDNELKKHIPEAKLCNNYAQLINLMILATSGQRSYNIRTSIPEISGHEFL